MEQSEKNLLNLHFNRAKNAVEREDYRLAGEEYHLVYKIAQRLAMQAKTIFDQEEYLSLAKEYLNKESYCQIMESKKEKVVASSFSTPCKRIADIVAPLLDTPGKTAIPCKTPVNILVLVSISAVLRNLKFSPAYNKHAVKTNPQPSSLPSISDGASNLKTNANTTVGTHARIIYPLVLLIG